MFVYSADSRLSNNEILRHETEGCQYSINPAEESTMLFVCGNTTVFYFYISINQLIISPPATL